MWLFKRKKKPLSNKELMRRADKGDKSAMIKFISRCYLSKNEVFKKQMEWKCNEYINRLAMSDHPAGCIWLADLLLSGENNVRKDVKTALLLYKKAGDEGDQFGYECVAHEFFEGKHLPANYEKAYKYLSKLNKPSIGSQYMLGEMYRKGLYVDRDEDKARECYDEAIRMGKKFFEEYGLEDDFYLKSVDRVNEFYK